MNRNCLSLGLLSASACLFLFHSGWAAAQPVPLGAETRVDTAEGKQPNEPALAVQPGGDFEIAWGYLDVSPPFVAARHFAADGAPTDATQVSLGAWGPYPRVKSVTATQGGFEVLWQLEGTYRVPSYRRHLDLDGKPAPGKPVRLGKGVWWVWQVRGHGFLGGWPTQTNGLASGLSIQRLSPTTGQVTGSVVRLNTRPIFSVERPLLTALADGGFLAVWTGVARVGNDYGMVLRARRFSAAGKPVGPDFDVDSVPEGAQDALHYPKVAASPAGGFAVAWRFFDAFSGTDNVSTPYVRLFDAAGRPRGPEIAGAVTQYVEALAFDDAGNLLVLWADDSTRGPADLEVQVLGPDGAPLGPQTRLASEASGAFTRPVQGSAAWGGSSWIVTWVADNEANLPRPRAIFVRRFAGE